jgi:hypothetical protein
VPLRLHSPGLRVGMKRQGLFSSYKYQKGKSFWHTMAAAMHSTTLRGAFRAPAAKPAIGRRAVIMVRAPLSFSIW